MGPNAKGKRGPLVERRPFYPSNLEPLPAERRDLKARSRTLTDLQRAHQRRCDGHLVARDHNVAPRTYLRTILAFSSVLGGVALASVFGGEATNVWLHGMFSEGTGAALIPGGASATVGVAIQGAVGTAWYMATMDNAKRWKNDLVLKQFQEWSRSVKVTDGDLMDALLPRYVEDNPYDPTDDEFNFVIGEHYGTQGHKFSNEAQFYKIPFSGLVTGGTVCFGVSGTGKTASILKNFMRQVLSWKADVDNDGSGNGMEKVAGLFLDPKGSLAEEVRSALVAAGVDPIRETGKFSEAKARYLSPMLYHRHADAHRPEMERKFEGKLSTQLARQAIALLGFAGATLAREGQKGEGFVGNIQQKHRHRVALLRERKRRYLLGVRGKDKSGAWVYKTHIDPNVRPFRGREGDYLELGFDDFRVNRIINAHNGVQAACAAFSKGLMEAPPAGKETTVPSSQDAEKESVKKLDTEIVSRLVLPSRDPQTLVPWTPKGEAVASKALPYALNRLMQSVERLMSVVFIASKERHMVQEKPILLSSSPDILLLEGVPGTRIGAKDDMESYADLRDLIRRLAPTKERPGENVLEYRCRYLMREAAFSIYNNSMAAVLENLKSSLRTLEWLAADYGQIRPLVADLYGFLALAQMSLKDALGPGGYEAEEDRGRGEVAMNPVLARELRRVESYLSPAALGDMKSGSLLAFRMVKSNLPTPRPRSKKEEEKMGPRFSRPDTIVELVKRIGELREAEQHLGASFKGWMAAVLTAAQGTAQMLGGRVDLVVADLQDHFVEKNPKLREVLRRGFDMMVSDLVEELPLHLGEAFAAWLVAYPARKEDSTEGLSNQSCVVNYVNAEVDKAPIPFTRVLQECALSVQKQNLEFNTHLYGPGPLGGLMMERFANGAVARSIVDLMTRGQDNAYIAYVARRLRELQEEALAHLVRLVLKAWADGQEAGGRNPKLGLEETVRGLWVRSREVMVDLAEIYRVGEAANMVAEMDHMMDISKELALSRSSGVGAWDPPKWEPTILFTPVPYRAFWRGLPAAAGTPLGALSTFDATWSTVLWKRLHVALQSAPARAGAENAPGWSQLNNLVETLADYHQCAMDAFAFYVAPNAGHKCDGPFCFNPVYLPGLAITNVSSTFTKAVFGAMNKGGKSDPFWENSSNALVGNLLSATKLLYGYATFPILSKLISDKEGLKNVIKRLELKRANRQLRSDEMLDVQNILGWYYGQWETPGADKGETKVNIIATLSVVTNAFLDPGYQIAFAPQRLADISFPGWEWIFKHGKVVAVNLPIEKHAGVTPVVLALLNKSFQKYAQMRDQSRVENAKLTEENHATPRGRLKIKLLEQARDVVLQKVDERRDWQEALADWDHSMGGGYPSEGRGDLISQLLPETSGVGNDNEPISETLRTVVFTRSVIRDSAMAFCLGVLGKKSGVSRAAFERIPLDPAARGAYRAGTLIEKVMTIPGLPWPKEMWLGEEPLQIGQIQKKNWSEGRAEAVNLRKLMTDADHVIDLLGKQGHDTAHAIVELAGGPTRFKELFRLMPAALALPRKIVFHPAVQARLSQEKLALDAELNDLRSGRGGLGAGLSLIAKVRDLTREIREIEDALEMMPNCSRYVVWTVDEAHFYLEGESDAQYASVSRSARMINMIACQGPSSIYSRMDEKVADALLINFPNRIVLRQADADEAETCANMLGGKHRTETVDRSMTQSFEDLHGGTGGGRGKASGGSVQTSVKEEERFVVEPSLLTQLPAFQAVAVSWDGFTMQEPAKVWVKPDFLFLDRRIRDYDPNDPPKRSAKLPPSYPKGTDLFGLTAMRLMQLGVYGSRAKP